MAATVHPFLGDVETERLRLRRWSRDDAAGLAVVNGDPEVVAFLNDGVPLTVVQSRLVSDRVLEHWKTFHFGLWAVEEKGSGQLLGFAGVCHPLWFPEWQSCVEVGWRLRRDAWGRGYATEAGRAALDAGLHERGFDEIVAFVHPDNHRSAAVARRLGMSVEQRVRHPVRPHDLDAYVIRSRTGR